MPNVYQISARYRADLLAGDREAAARLAEQYGQAWQRIDAYREALQVKIDAARDAGEDISVAWLMRRDRLLALEEQTLASLLDAARSAGVTITDQQMQAWGMGADAAKELTIAALGARNRPDLTARVSTAWNALPDDVGRTLVGTLADGTPVADVLASYAGAAAAEVRSVMLTGALMGQNPRTIARRMRDVVGGDLTRAMTIARTETLRAYRQAELQSYSENADVVKAWRWQATFSARTCAMCIAMSGTTTPVKAGQNTSTSVSASTVFATHPNCRCVAVPVTRSWADLGFDGIPETVTTPPTGPEWFAAQPEETQRAILGPAKYSAWKDGAFGLRDLVAYRNDPTWGPMRWEKPLKSVA